MAWKTAIGKGKVIGLKEYPVLAYYCGPGCLRPEPGYIETGPNGQLRLVEEISEEEAYRQVPQLVMVMIEKMEERGFPLEEIVWYRAEKVTE